MIVCPACNHHNREGAQTCESCGRSLEHFLYRACPNCNALNPAQNMFCHRCFTEFEIVEQVAAAQEEAPVAQEAPAEAQSVEPMAAVAEAAPAEATPVETTTAEVIPTEQLASEPPIEELPTSVPEAASAAPEAAPAVPQAAPAAEYAVTQPVTPESASESMAEDVPEGVAETAAEERSELEAEARATTEAESATEAPEEQGAPRTVEGKATLVEPTSEASPLEGLQKGLPLEPAIVLPHLIGVQGEQSDKSEQADADLYYQLATERASLHEPLQMVRENKRLQIPKLARIVLSLLLILAAIAPLFTGGLTDSLVKPRQAVLDLSRTIQTLPKNSRLLLAFDYGPTYGAEMDMLAMDILRHLSTRNARLVILSTKPEGIGQAEKVLRALSTEMSSYTYGQDYAILGYLPGEEAGLRALLGAPMTTFKTDSVSGKSLDQLAVTSDLTSLDDVDRVILFSDNAQDVRRWVEQVAGASNVPIDALTTAAIEPMLVPYRQSGQLQHLVAGASGAAEYEMASQLPPLAQKYSDSYAALFLIVLVVVIVGNAVYVSKGTK